MRCQGESWSLEDDKFDLKYKFVSPKSAFFHYVLMNKIS
jgi:hypothetical protein